MFMNASIPSHSRGWPFPLHSVCINAASLDDNEIELIAAQVVVYGA
jgi:hypothetical protein